MLPRKMSIFNLGEELGEATIGCGAIAIRGAETPIRVPEGLVGLRILIEQPTKGSNVVIKPALKLCRSTAHPRHAPKSSLELGFLKACSFCKSELSPHKDVYMYRGDQGFCSEECRLRQILIDERREFDAATKDRLGVPPRHRAGTKIRESGRHKKISITA